MKNTALFLTLMALPVILLGQQYKVTPTHSTQQINKIISNLSAGDTLLFSEGSYKGPFNIKQLHGEINKPIVISGSTSSNTIIDGKAKPGMSQENNAFTITYSECISIENFTIKNCWTDLILADESSYISIKNCELFGGKRALFAKGRNSHHFLIEHCSWEQHEKVWSHEDDYTWEEIHHGLYVHYNGSLFQGSLISGVFVLRDNVIKNTFNAFRLAQIGNQKEDFLAATNGEIYRNKIINTSDNVLEPELHAGNLHFYHNEMINGHAFISLTEIAGGDIYIYGNTAVSLPESEDGWTIFKISSRERTLTRPLWIFNNSWQIDFDAIGSPRNEWKNNHIYHFNNAYFSENSDTFGIYWLGKDNYYDFDCSNVTFPKILISNNFEINGIVAKPGFNDPYKGDFRLKMNSPCIDNGKIDSSLILRYKGSKPDIGAYDQGLLVEGTPFKYMKPAIDVPYAEAPRICRYFIEGSFITLWFSTPMSKTDLLDTEFKLTSNSHHTILSHHSIAEDGYSIKLKSDTPMPTFSPELTLSKRPRGIDNLVLTNWASEIILHIED